MLADPTAYSPQSPAVNETGAVIAGEIAATQRGYAVVTGSTF